MTYEEDNQAKVLILILKEHRARFVAVPGAACLSMSCATAEHPRDREALSPVKAPIDFIVEVQGRFGLGVQQLNQLFLGQLRAVLLISPRINFKAALV